MFNLWCCLVLALVLSGTSRRQSGAPAVPELTRYMPSAVQTWAEPPLLQYATKRNSCDPLTGNYNNIFARPGALFPFLLLYIMSWAFLLESRDGTFPCSFRSTDLLRTPDSLDRIRRSSPRCLLFMLADIVTTSVTFLFSRSDSAHVVLAHTARIARYRYLRRFCSSIYRPWCVVTSSVAHRVEDNLGSWHRRRAVDKRHGSTRREP